MNAGLQACHDEDWDAAEDFAKAPGASLNEVDSDQWTMMHHAVWSSQPDLLRTLVAAGADPAVQDREGLTPATLAAAQGRWELTDLASTGKAVNLHDQDGWTPLHYAAAAGQERLVASLLARGADPTLADRESLTPGLAACAKAQWGTAALLADTGKALGAQDEDQWSMAHYAVDNAQSALLESLVRGKAPLTLRNADGDTPASIALNDPADRAGLWAVPILIKGGVAIEPAALAAAGLGQDGSAGAPRRALRH